MKPGPLFNVLLRDDGRLLIAIQQGRALDEEFLDRASEAFEHIKNMVRGSARPPEVSPASGEGASQPGSSVGPSPIIPKDPPGCKHCGEECRCGDDCGCDEAAERKGGMKGVKFEVESEPNGLVKSEDERGSFWRRYNLPDEVEAALELAEQMGARRMRHWFLHAGSGKGDTESDLLSLSPEQVETFEDLANWCGADERKEDGRSDVLILEELDCLAENIGDAFERINTASARVNAIKQMVVQRDKP